MIDFSQTKVCGTRRDGTGAVGALAAGRRDEALDEANKLGLQIVGAEPDFALTVCYILFDTRMDMMEAHVSPLDSNIPPEMRVVRIDTIPRRFSCCSRRRVDSRDAHLARHGRARADLAPVRPRRASQRERTRALVGARAGRPSTRPRRKTPAATANKAATPGSRRGPQSMYAKMKSLALFMKAHNLPCDRKAMMPFASSGLTSLEAIAAGPPSESTSSTRRFGGSTTNSASGVWRWRGGTRERGGEAGRRVAGGTGQGGGEG